MSDLWVVVEEPGGARRAPLLPGPNRVGGGGAEVAVGCVGTDQVLLTRDEDGHVEARFVGAGAAPLLDGAPLQRALLEPGARLAWGAATLRLERVAPLEELEAGRAGGSAAEARLRAGLLVDLGLVDRRVLKRWQDAVVAGEFDAELAAAELAGSAREVEESLLSDRAGRLLRDFVMAPVARGVGGAARATRRGVKTGVAFVIAQATALAVFTLIVLLCLLFLRLRGVELDAFLDAVLRLFGRRAPDEGA